MIIFSRTFYLSPHVVFLFTKWPSPPLPSYWSLFWTNFRFGSYCNPPILLYKNLFADFCTIGQFHVPVGYYLPIAYLIQLFLIQLHFTVTGVIIETWTQVFKKFFLTNFFIFRRLWTMTKWCVLRRGAVCGALESSVNQWSFSSNSNNELVVVVVKVAANKVAVNELSKKPKMKWHWANGYRA